MKRVNRVLCVMFLFLIVTLPNNVAAQDSELMDELIEFLDLWEGKWTTGEALALEEIESIFGEDYVYIETPGSDMSDMTGMISYDYGEFEAYETISFIEFEDEYTLFFGIARTGNDSNERAAMTTDEYLEWVNEFVEVGETDLDVLDEQYTL